MDGNELSGIEEPSPKTTQVDNPLPSPTPGSEYRQVWVILSAIAVGLAAAWLYHRALGFVFFNDDPTGHFAWMEGRSVWQFFSSSAEYGYYRPMVFTVLRFMERVFGNTIFPHNPVADHALLVLLHGANAALVWLLAYRLGHRSPAYAWIAALVFATAPFSYEAVAYVASLTHPLHVFWVLVALLLFDRGRETANRRVLVLSGMAQIIALLTHENGLFVFPAMVGLDFVARPLIPFRARARALWPFILPPLLFSFLWLAIPKNSQQGLNALGDMGRNLLPFLQSLVYPILPVLNLDAGDVGVLVGVALGLVTILGLLARQRGALRLWGFALSWVFLAALPAALFLSPAYVFGSPRLSYLPAVGVALIWAIPGLLATRKESTDDADLRSYKAESTLSGIRIPNAIVAALMVGYSLVLVIPGLPFIRCQLDFYDETSGIARQMATIASDAPTGRGVVFVNLPFFFSSTAGRPDGCPSPYPWTPTGGILLPPYAQARDFVRFNGGPDRPVRGVSFAGYAPGWRTFGPDIAPEELRAAVEADAVYVFDLPSVFFGDLQAAWQPGMAADDPVASFGEVLDLTGARLEQADDRLIIELNWRVTGQPRAPLATLMHVYDSAGALVAQADGPPGDRFVPQSMWQTNDGLRDIRRLDLSSLPPGRYTVATGVYSQADGIRLPAVQDGQPLADDIYVIGALER